MKLAKFANTQLRPAVVMNVQLNILASNEQIKSNVFLYKHEAGVILAFSAIWLAAAESGILRISTIVSNPIGTRNGKTKAKKICM
jgi:hypothetical protein